MKKKHWRATRSIQVCGRPISKAFEKKENKAREPKPNDEVSISISFVKLNNTNIRNQLKRLCWDKTVLPSRVTVQNSEGCLHCSSTWICQMLMQCTRKARTHSALKFLCYKFNLLQQHSLQTLKNLIPYQVDRTRLKKNRNYLCISWTAQLLIRRYLETT